MLSQKKFSLKIIQAECFLELLGVVLQHFWVLLEKMFKNGCFSIHNYKNDYYNIFVSIFNTFGATWKFFYPGFQASRNPKEPWNWLILTNFNVWGIFPTQLLSRNLIFNAKFKYSISPGNFQKFSGTLDIAWK